jgi:hypothetical protein
MSNGRIKIVASFLTFTIAVTGCGAELPATFNASDLIGTWRGDYVGIAPIGVKVTGVETLTLREDGRYQQIYEDGKGYVYVSTWNKWYLDESKIVHLEGGRWYPLGIPYAERLALGMSHASVIDWAGKRVELNGKEALLLVHAHRGAPRGMILMHMPVGDPDSPQTVKFYLVATPVPIVTITR